jgi:hypothetical protein
MANAPQRKPYRVRFLVQSAQPVVLEVPTLAPMPTVSATARGMRASGRTTRRTAAIVQAGLGLGALALGTVLALTAREHYEAAPGCLGNLCGESGLRARESAIQRANVATWMFTFSIASFAGASVLWFSGPRGIAVAWAPRQYAASR